MCLVKTLLFSIPQHLSLVPNVVNRATVLYRQRTCCKEEGKGLDRALRNHIKPPSVPILLEQLVKIADSTARESQPHHNVMHCELAL